MSPLVCNGCGSTARKEDDTFPLWVAGVTVTCCLCGVGLAVEMTAEGIAAYLQARPAVWEQVQRLVAVEPTADVERAKRYAAMPWRLGTAPHLDNGVHWQVGSAHYVTLRSGRLTKVYASDDAGYVSELLGMCQPEVVDVRQPEVVEPVDHEDALRRVLARTQ